MVKTSCIRSVGFLSLAIAVPLIVTVAEICEETKSGVMFREALKGHRLVNSLLDTISSLSIVECSLQCLQETDCQSVNYRKELNTMKEHDCELNSEKASVNPGHVTRDDSFTYYEITGTGKSAKTCTKASLGSRKDVPGKSCGHIKLSTNTSSSQEYWIQPEPDESPFLVHCEMSLFGGGWTLVYSYTFTNYANFYSSTNAVKPRPSWRAPGADVETSTTPPLKDTFGAIAYRLWRMMGKNVLIKSNINDWYECEDSNGSVVLEVNGPISCKHVREIAGSCSSNAVPTYIYWENIGPMMRGSTTVYRFDGSTSKGYPTHNSCTNGIKNEKRNVTNPYGQILIR
ncbi:uncharacterized protein LOC114525346 [Dendronephthya gigantea]|uniref:uncharacterized protein LOC114525346 n=1 Tax=Dendronephthya gigantea TaxID=151771 RepID=UPI00106A6FC7|nr:uncharacterized protein LOC114525346 [Dendronephthya gigantea]